MRNSEIFLKERSNLKKQLSKGGTRSPTAASVGAYIYRALSVIRKVKSHLNIFANH